MSEPRFEERETCWMLLNEQLSEIWHKMRIGRATSSTISSLLGHSKYGGANRDYIMINILKQKKAVFSPEAVEAMRYGVEEEPLIRQQYQEMLSKNLSEVSLAIWKKDQRLAGSLDFEVIEEDGTSVEGGEIKAPQRPYRDLVEFYEAVRKGYLEPDYLRCRKEQDMQHIFRSHYDQMIANAIFTNKERMHYVVRDKETRQMYWDIFPVDKDYFEEQIFAPIQVVLNEKIDPLMISLGIERMNVHDYI